MEETLQQTISEIDSQPIMQMNDADFYKSQYFEGWRNQLAGNYGSTITRALNTQSLKAKGEGRLQGKLLLLKDILAGTKAKTTAPVSSHLRLIEPNGETEEFLLGIRWYTQGADGAETQAKSYQNLSAEESWLALDPDRFYLQDDAEGNEQWPVTFTAVNMADTTRTMRVTFDKDGYVSSSIENGPAAKSSGSTVQPNLAFAEPMSIYLEDDCESEYGYADCQDGSSGGGGTGTGRINDYSRGSNTGSYAPNSTYFIVKSIRLADTGDGDGASELQMFVKNNDDYNHNFPISYKYRFDKVIRTDPIYGGYDDHTIIAGADRGGIFDRYYQVPDVNQAGVDYNYFFLFARDPFGNYVTPGIAVDYFPLFNLTQRPGPWRLVMSDDDKDYPDFSIRRQSEYATSVWTYDMNNGIWQQISTGFTVDRKTYGSSDDPILESGVRRITLDNVEDRLNGSSTRNIVATKNYTYGKFRYIFALR